MTTDLATILATKIRTALESNPDTNPVNEALKLGQLAVLAQQAGLSLTPPPEAKPEPEPGQTSDTQSHPSGVTVTRTGWKVAVDGKFAGMVDALTGDFKAYVPGGRGGVAHDSLDAAVSYIVAQQRTPSPERSVERGRDDAEEDSRREDEAVQA